MVLDIYFFQLILNSFLPHPDWSTDMSVPFDIKVLYVIQCGFYLHSVYATLYMDSVRKDFHIMMFHHFLTITLVVFSYVLRCILLGNQSPTTNLPFLFVAGTTKWVRWCFFCTIWPTCACKRPNSCAISVCDRIVDNVLAGSKVLMSLSWSSVCVGEMISAPEQTSKPFAVLLDLLFFSFSHRFVSRLYWFPLKVLYTTGVVSMHRSLDKTLHFYVLFNILLWILLCLNVYWFVVSIDCSTATTFHSWLWFSWFFKPFTEQFLVPSPNGVTFASTRNKKRKFSFQRKTFLLIRSENVQLYRAPSSDTHNVNKKRS